MAVGITKFARSLCMIRGQIIRAKPPTPVSFRAVRQVHSSFTAGSQMPLCVPVSLRILRELCGSAVKSFQETVTAETLRTPSWRREFRSRHHGNGGG